MLKLVLFTAGLAGGSGGVAAWLLSEPGPSEPSSPVMPDRLEELKRRLKVALAEGARAGAETENRIRHEFDAYRLHPDRTGASA